MLVVELVHQLDLQGEPEHLQQVAAEEMVREQHLKWDVSVNQEQHFLSLAPQLFMELVAAVVDIQLLVA
jgi:hypothetical protein